MEYDTQFICCSCEITESKRKRIMRKYRKKHAYDSMEPVTKKGVQRTLKNFFNFDMVQRKRNITDPDPLNRVLISLREVSYFI